MNNVVIGGRIVADAKLVTKPGFDVVMFQLENTIGFGDKKRTSIFNVKKFGKKVGNIVKFLVKDRQVEVVGKLAVETFQQNGATKSVILIAATEIELGWLPKDKTQQKGNDGYDSDFTGGDNAASANEPEPNDFFGA
jgi:single-stranded DNA-binding protein